MRDVKVCEGSLVRMNPPLDIHEIEYLMKSDDVLKKGLLFIGGARQGKTNVMMKLAGDIFRMRNPDDLMVFLDVKGDYRETFYCDGDAVLSPTEDGCLWNFFDELKGIPFGGVLEARVLEIVEYLYYGQESPNMPFWNNAAKYITYCLILYLLLEADASGDDGILNHGELCRLIDSEIEGADFGSVYESYRELLQSYDRFRTAGMFLPPPESGAQMGVSVITEVVVMRRKLLWGNFGKQKTRNGQQYLSPGTLPFMHGEHVLFLEYNPRYQQSCESAFRAFTDMLIAAFLETGKTTGRLYLFLDELALLPELNRLDQALNLGAEHGIRVVAGLQEIEQLRHCYQSHPHRANVILDAFQSQIVFNSDIETSGYISKKLGNALVQRRHTRAGGGVGYSEPVMVPSVEQYEFDEFIPGDAIVHFSGRKAFKTHFPLYVKE